MVGNENLRNLETLACQYGIRQKLQSDAWPSSLLLTVQDIQELSQRTFETYSSLLNSEPWKRENRARAEWLVEQTGRLSQNTFNETTWRDRIEPAVLEKFSLEPACPICKHRLWRSEIESSFTGSSRVWAEQDQRRLDRGPCTCPISDRPQNRYEVITSKLFEARLDEAVVYDVTDRELPTQRPDRVVGLRETANIHTILDQSPQSQANSETRRIRDLVMCSPFARRSDPPLFPFLILEAKSDSASASFSAVQMQTAFPIRLLLNLQRDLQSLKRSEAKRPEPLVWFLAYKGSDWKLYGCYMGYEAQPIYNIHYLQGGDSTTKDGALRLLLLMDYIVDWARDTFRPSIIAQLRCLQTGTSFDEVSLGADSDILSKKRGTQDWITRVSNAIVPDDWTHAPGSRPIHRGTFDETQQEELLYTKLGAVRSVSPLEFRLTGLRVTEANVESLLALSEGPSRASPSESDQEKRDRRGARKLLKELMRWDEVLVILGDDLDYVERVWANMEQTMDGPFDEGPGAAFYAIFEYRCVMNESWQIIRELSYFAVSKSAYDILMDAAAYQKRRGRGKAFSNVLRPCSSAAIKEAMECLGSGSAWQVFHAAVSSTLLTLFPLPQKIRSDFMPPVEFLEFGHTHSLRVRSFIDDYIN